MRNQMQTPRTRTRWLVALALAGLAVAGCGNSDAEATSQDANDAGATSKDANESAAGSSSASDCLDGADPDVVIPSDWLADGFSADEYFADDCLVSDAYIEWLERDEDPQVREMGRQTRALRECARGPADLQASCIEDETERQLQALEG